MSSAPTPIPPARPATRAPSSEVAWLAHLLPAGRPRRVAQMHACGDAKYRDLAKTQPLTPAMLAAHVAGRATYATTLDLHGLAEIGAMDVDEPTPERGRAALLTLLDALRRAGLRAVATNVNNLSNPAAPHCGGHIFVPYDGAQSAAAITAQLHQIAAAAGYPKIEVWPRNQSIRLPLGYHQRAQTFGTLITQDGETFDLDDPTARIRAWTYVMALPRNAAPPALPEPEITAPPVPIPRPALRVSPGEAGADRLNARAAIDRFNQAHRITDLLDQYGAVRTRDGYTCNCGVAHSSATQLQVLSGNTIVSYSDRCRWAPHLRAKKATDPFGLYCIVEHGGDKAAALRVINPPPSAPRSRPAPPHSVETVEYTVSPAAQAQRATQNAHRRKTYAGNNAARIARIRASVEARANAETGLPTVLTLALMAILEAIETRDYCYDSVAGIAQLAGYKKRQTQTALKELTARGYITRTPRKRGETWTTRLLAQADYLPSRAQDTIPMGAIDHAQTRCVAPESEHDHESHAESETCERAPAPPAPSCVASSAASVAPQARADCELRIVRADGRYQVADQHGAIHGTHASEAAAYAHIGTLYGALDDGARDDAAPLEGASYNPAEDCSRLDRAARTPLPLLPYERPALLRGFAFAPTGWTPPDAAAADVPAVAAQHQLDVAPVAVASVRTPTRTSAAYAQKLAAMSDRDFAGEQRRITNAALSRKHAGAPWVKRCQAAIERERKQRSWAPAPAARGHTARGSQAPRIERGRSGVAADVGVQNLRLFDDLALPPARSVAAIAAIAQ